VRVELSPGEAVVVTFRSTDGEITFGESSDPLPHDSPTTEFRLTSEEVLDSDGAAPAPRDRPSPGFERGTGTFTGELATDDEAIASRTCAHLVRLGAEFSCERVGEQWIFEVCEAPIQPGFSVAPLRVRIGEDK
jgi:hypothetical protein